MPDVIERGTPVLLQGETNTYLKIPGKDNLHVKEGMVAIEDLLGNTFGETVETNTGNTFLLLEPRLHDFLEHRFERSAQFINQKDIGTILAETALGEDDTVIEAGTGSGFLTAALANVCDHIYTYERNEKRFHAAKRNLADTALDNITFHNTDVQKHGFEQDDVDIVVLDMGGLEYVIDHASASVKPGGWVVCYCPVIEQANDAVDAFDESIKHVKTVETIRRTWQLDPSRPANQELAHTAFLVFGRKH